MFKKECTLLKQIFYNKNKYSVKFKKAQIQNNEIFKSIVIEES